MKKRLKAWTCLAGCILLAPTPSWADGPVGHWPLDDGGGSTTIDISGNNNNATVSGAQWVTGRFDGALRFDGTSDHASVDSPSEVLRPGGAFAVATWFAATTTDTEGGDMVSMGDSYGLVVLPSGDVNYFVYDGSEWIDVHTNGVDLLDGNWHHALGQFNGAQLELWVDGVRVRRIDWTGAICYDQGTAFVLGRHGNGETTWDFTGDLDDVRVYAETLGTARIEKLAGICIPDCSSPCGGEDDGCGEPCPLNDGAACPDDGNDCTLDVCSGGACTHPDNGSCSACDPGYADCNASPDDGCEVDTRSDARHCGGCNQPCEADEACEASHCVQTGACEQGRNLCDGMCVNTRTSPVHCGICNHPCPAGDACIDGQCHPRCGPGTELRAEQCVAIDDSSGCGMGSSGAFPASAFLSCLVLLAQLLWKRRRRIS